MIRKLRAAVLFVVVVVGVGVLAAGIASGQRSRTFTDVPDGAYYYDAAYWAADVGVTTGCADDKFCPDDNLTRAQMITFLYRYDTNGHVHAPDHTHPVREVESDPIRVEGPAGTDQDCTQYCEIGLSGFNLSQDTVLLVGADIAPGKWKFNTCGNSFNDERAVVLTKAVRKHPQYPGREYWGNWFNDLHGVRTGIATHSSGGNDDVAQMFSHSRIVFFEVLPHDYAVIYGCE